jgi:hypothetical protein
MEFEKNVFVNCPFDDDYRDLLRPILFVILDLGLYPRIALEELNAGKARLEKILGLIRDSKYAIHDLSRIQAVAPEEYYRMNMPFELGLDIGCQLFGGEVMAGKRCLILEEKPYRYQAAISDMSNADIYAHGGKAIEAMRHVRDWLNSEAKLKAHGTNFLWGRFHDFMSDNYKNLTDNRGFADEDIKRLKIDELMEEMKGWIANHPADPRNK